MIPPSDLLEPLKTRYAEPQRHYHTWAHIEALLRHFGRLKPHLNRPEAVLWALYWHDAIYDPMAKDNEDESADLLQAEAGTHLAPDDLALADKIIRATAKHVVPEGLSPEDESDLCFFLDMDLSILAARPDVFDQYERDVRAEYAAVPDMAFRAGRSMILQGFLKRDRLYFTDTCRAEWEEAARANLARSVAALEASL
ncbi:MAG: hypothetical protein V7651_00490 [Hyphomonas oceanitis]|uniref:HD domain-containing protein n=1 Tax=Hyphomonas oceanitis TaxID=81033 RepID=UPI0030019062